LARQPHATFAPAALLAPFFGTQRLEIHESLRRHQLFSTFTHCEYVSLTGLHLNFISLTSR